MKKYFHTKLIKTYRIYLILLVNANRNSENSSEQKYWCLEIISQTPLWH